MALYDVKVTKSVYAVVDADSEEHAKDIALRDLEEIMRDAPGVIAKFKIKVRDKITSLLDLPKLWEEYDRPYGNGDKTIHEILFGKK